MSVAATKRLKSARITVTSSRSTHTASSIKDLQTLLSQEAGDLKIMREIPHRIEGSLMRRN
ncbi:hypothetical protein CN063_25415 [Sinorhizobium meliloti]|nr:hypothetical protein DU99_19395 [Sinorhizobium meliloti]RVO81741.1 hypothetical protein CN088_26990 [Sinorhizobium meliloti]RVQ09988.1 hypothetical protein CN063_25415 [Sinorhizobium meliloti]